MKRSVERRDSEGFIAIGKNHTSALTVLCLIIETLNEGGTHLIEIVM